MASMSDFHVVGDPRFAPDVPSGDGGVSKEYVDNADLNVKKTTAEASNDKYDESVIPSQLTNKLYVFGNPQSMYPASEIGGDVPAITEGRVDYSYDYWDSDVYPNREDYKIYNSTYNRLFCIKSANDSVSNYYSIFGTDGSEEITAIGGDIRQSVRDSLAGHMNTYVQRYSGDPLTPQGWQLETDGAYVAGGSPIYNTRTYNSYFGLVGTGIPIFTVSDNTTASFDAVNHYITTGDYSGADNYTELYPDNPESYVAIDVISGDWYKVVNSAWVKQGTLTLKGSDVVANPEGEATDTLTTIEIDGTIYDIAGGGASITDLIPLMTSDTTPSGTVSYSSQFGSSYAGYMAFNQVQADISMMTGGWLPSDSDSAPYLQYAWTSPKKLSKLWIETANNGASATKTITVEGYNGSSWENCLKSGNTVTLDFDYGQYEEFEIELNGNNYSAIRISGNEQWFYLNSTACTISRMQAYSISGGISADGVSYDNSNSDLSADDVQDAIDELSDEKADKSTSLSGYGITDAYTKTEVDTALNAKANTADLGTASAKNYTTSVTQGSNDLVTSGAVWTAIDNLPEPMIFKGTLGTNGTITTLPTASSSNEGWTYKVITAGTYAGQSAKVGDLFASNATEWVYIPSGDETDTDTWRGINVNGSQLLDNGISSGNVNFKSGTNAQVSGSGNDITVDVDTTFTDASSRVNIASGDSIKTILGKIKKWFSDLKTVAFTNSYEDLDNKPQINNATLNIKKNGTSQGTFTANASTDVNIDISVPTKTSDLANDSGYINSGATNVIEVNDTTPYLYKASEHNAVYDKLVGGSFGWNQLVQNGNFASMSGWSGQTSTISINNNVCTITPTSFNDSVGILGNVLGTITGHKYSVKANVKYNSKAPHQAPWLGSGGYNGVTNPVSKFVVGQWVELSGIFARTSGGLDQIAFYPRCKGWTSSDTVSIKDIICIDLTLMFGSTIADYAYSLEQSTAGSGVAWLKSYGFFTKDYYPYNAGGLQSVKTSGKKVVGKNLFNGQFENGYYDSSGKVYSVDWKRSAEYIDVVGGQNYVLSGKLETLGNYSSNGIFFYTKDGSYLAYALFNIDALTFSKSVVTPQNCAKIGFYTRSNANIKYIQVEKGSATTYEPYTSTTYLLGNDELRGIPKLVSNQLVYDGDVKTSDGKIGRKYGIVDLGSLNWYYSDVGNKYFYTLVTGMKYQTSNSICSQYSPNTTYGQAASVLNNKEFNTVIYQNYLYIRDDSYTDATAFKTAMNGVYLVYELATHTTEYSTPFTSPQMVYSDGTEEYIDTRDVPIPVGGDRVYIDIPEWMDNEYFDDLRSNAILNTATVDLGNEVYLEKSGNVVNIEICGLYGNNIASKTIPVGYRPKRQLRIPARFVDSGYNETVGTFIINVNGTIAAQYQIAVPGAMTSLTTSIYKVHCNTTYIV